jgi:hypothetical protein
MKLAIFTLFLTFKDWKPPKYIFSKKKFISHFGAISPVKKMVVLRLKTHWPHSPWSPPANPSFLPFCPNPQY